MADWLERDRVKPAAGGTEILRAGLSKYTSIDQRDDINIILCVADYSKVKFTKSNILWQHNNYSDESVKGMQDPGFMKAIDATVYVSHWQYEKFRYLYRIPTHNAHIIKNAIEPIEFKPRERGEKIKLIYTSTPFRGLEILLDVFETLDRDDVELDVYSSTLVYGTGYQNHTKGQFDDLFDRARGMKNVNYHGYATNDEVKQALTQANIFSYPSIFEETACLAMIEAAAAGCKLVTTNLGALYETGSEWATMVPIQADIDGLKADYAKALNEAIDSYWSEQDFLKRQSDFYNEFYDWERRVSQWEQVFNDLS